MEILRMIASWLAVLGVPGIFTIVVFLFRSVIKAMKNIEILQKAQKAQRAQRVRKARKVHWVQ